MHSIRRIPNALARVPVPRILLRRLVVAGNAALGLGALASPPLPVPPDIGCAVQRRTSVVVARVVGGAGVVGRAAGAGPAVVLGAGAPLRARLAGLGLGLGPVGLALSLGLWLGAIPGRLRGLGVGGAVVVVVRSSVLARAFPLVEAGT